MQTVLFLVLFAFNYNLHALNSLYLKGFRAFKKIIPDYFLL